jgi:hypothetical protein
MSNVVLEFMELTPLTFENLESRYKNLEKYIIFSGDLKLWYQDIINKIQVERPNSVRLVNRHYNY